ncbi:MAG: lyase family protein [Marinomonas sp.]
MSANDFSLDSPLETRVETDLIGALEVPVDALYGVQTQRAIALYPLNGEKPLSAYPVLIKAMLRVKRIAAQTNLNTGELEPKIAQSIIQVINRLLDDLPLEQFPVHACHGGGGISTNMNINEVVANLVNRDAFFRPLGTYSPVHPNDHINLNNSTSDAQTTACHFAVIEQWQSLESSIDKLINEFNAQGAKWQHEQKIARTCLQDAVEISFADLFSGYQSLIERNKKRLNQGVIELYKINLGGNIIGRKGDVSQAFFESIIDQVNTQMYTSLFCHSDNLFDSSQNHDDLISIANRLELFARGLIKIAKDFRLMSSGPETGFAELNLPAVQPGSSAMPGKVNPTIAEYLVQCCMQVCGRCYTIQMTQDHGELDLNVWQSLVIHNLLDAMTCLENGIQAFTQHCLSGVTPNSQQNQQNIQTMIPTLIRLKQEKGYSYASKVFKESQGDITKVRAHLIKDKQGS